MYKPPNVQNPSLEDIREIAKSQNLGIAGDDIGTYHNLICGLISKSYSVLDKYIEPAVPIKYPRTPGYRPQPEDNKYNAWYYKTDIQGAPAGPLKGYKVAIKDNYAVAGVPMMFGSRVFEGYVPDFDATVVTRILDAGGEIAGKATCENMACSGNSFTSCPAPVLNPHDVTRSSGGSSSGSAVLVKTGEVDMAIGNDSGGSIRIPASWTGIVGLKPTHGLVPCTGLLTTSGPAIEVTGPLTRTVKDCALLLEVLAGDDGQRDPRQLNIPSVKDVPKYSQLLTGNLSGCKIGLVREGFHDCEEDVVAVVRESAMKLQDKGAVVEYVSIPMHKDADAITTVTTVEGNYHLTIKGNGFLVHPPCSYPTSAIANFTTYMRNRRRDFPQTMKLASIAGQYIDDNYGLYFYGKSQNLLKLLREEYDKALDTYDVLVMPTMKYKAPKLPQSDIPTDEYIAEALKMGANTGPFNGTGHPALSINAGFSEDLPVGMTIIGRHMQDDKVLNVAYAYEDLRDNSS